MITSLLEADEVAVLLHVSRQWVIREAWKGRIPSRKIGRKRLFTFADVESYIASVAQKQNDPWASPRLARRVP